MALKVNGVEIIGGSSTITIAVPAFRATGSAGWTNVTAGSVAPFNACTSGGNNIQTNHDALLNYDATNYRFTAPVDGTYLFYASLYTHNDANQETYSFYKNGSAMNVYDSGSQFFNTQFPNAEDNHSHMQMTTELATNDYIDCRGTNNACDVYMSYSLFGGYLIGKKR